MALVGAFLPSPGTIAEQDPYLRALESEVGKVEPNRIGDDSESVLSPGANAAGRSSSRQEAQQETALVRDRFESMLRQRYAGTYGFYTRLPERSQQEILAEYRDGADIVQLRRMIIDRFYGNR